MAGAAGLNDVLKVGLDGCAFPFEIIILCYYRLLSNPSCNIVFCDLPEYKYFISIFDILDLLLIVTLRNSPKIPVDNIDILFLLCFHCN